jgi:DNA-binding CsgD family transcriptional regulator
VTFRSDLEGCADLDRLLADTRNGEGGCLILRGRSGAGKTALLEYAVDRAGDVRSVRVRGVASETEFRFAALHQMLAPLLAGLDRIPPPQQHALREVVGLAYGPDPDRFLVGLAVLTLLIDAAGERPLLVVVDDAQWLDHASAEVLAFVARRLHREPIAVVVALRVPARGSAAFAGLPGRYVNQPEGRSATGGLPQPRCAVGCTAGPFVGRFGQTPNLLQVASAESPGTAVRLALPADAAIPSRMDGLRRLGEQVTPIRQPMGSAQRPPSAADAAAPPTADAPVSRLRDGIVVRDTDGYPAAVLILRPVVAALLAEPDGADSELFAMACTAAGELLDDEAQYAVADRWVGAERDGSRPESLLLALTALAQVEVLAGRLVSADSTLAEARLVAGADGRPPATTAIRSAELIVLAWRGRDEQATSAANRPRDGSGPAGPGAVQSALTVLDLASGRYPAALARALDIRRDDPPDHGTRILPDLIEAASRTRNPTAATAALDRLAERAVASGTPLALGLLARSRALLADGTTADGLYREARAYLEQTGQTSQLARTRLLHGEWLRRRRRRRDAREHLVAAADMFEAMGMNAFLQRTRMELRATGERVGRRADDMNNHLTPQEARIAQLVADGLTNPEIATHLFISLSTVEYHLQKVFRKFAVTSRTQLTRALLTANP